MLPQPHSRRNPSRKPSSSQHMHILPHFLTLVHLHTHFSRMHTSTHAPICIPPHMQADTHMLSHIYTYSHTHMHTLVSHAHIPTLTNTLLWSISLVCLRTLSEGFRLQGGVTWHNEVSLSCSSFSHFHHLSPPLPSISPAVPPNVKSLFCFAEAFCRAPWSWGQLIPLSVDLHPRYWLSQSYLNHVSLPASNIVMTRWMALSKDFCLILSASPF